jgi:hypothetical protein
MRKHAPRNGLSAPDVRAVPVFIYALCEPDGGHVRYVGKSSYPRGRLASHRTGGNSRLRMWILKLEKLGVEPDLRVLRKVDAGENAAEAERAAIAEHDDGTLLQANGTVARRKLWLSNDQDREQLRELAILANDAGLLSRVQSQDERRRRERESQRRQVYGPIRRWQSVIHRWELTFDEQRRVVVCLNVTTGEERTYPGASEGLSPMLKGSAQKLLDAWQAIQSQESA